MTSAVPSPLGIFVTASGTLYISSQTGYVYTMAICSGQAVSPAIVVSLPGAALVNVAVSAGNLYVVQGSVDANYPAGTVWRYPSGATLCTAAAPCGAGSGRVAIGGVGAFVFPIGISIAANGDVFVADTNKSRGEVVRVPADGGASSVVVNSVGAPAGLGQTGGVFVTAAGDIVTSFVVGSTVAWVPASALPVADMAPYGLGAQTGNGHSVAVYVTQAGVVYASFNGNAVVRRYESGFGWTTVGYAMSSPQGLWSACNS